MFGVNPGRFVLAECPLTPDRVRRETSVGRGRESVSQVWDSLRRPRGTRSAAAVVGLAVLALSCAGGAGARIAPPEPAALSVTVHGAGEVTSMPEGIACPDACDATFDAGTTVALQAASTRSNARFARWGGACAAFSEPTCEVVLDADAAVDAEFVLVAAAKARARTNSRRVKTTTSTTTAPTPPPSPPPPPPAQPPVTGGAPPTADAAKTDSVADRIIGRLQKARIVFNVPKTLRIHHTSEIQLRLSVRESLRQLSKQIAAGGKRQGATIHISDVMEAHLAGTGFKVEAVTPEIQAVSDFGVTQWEWEIEPTKSGTQRLHLTMTAHVVVPGRAEAVHTIRTFAATLTIRVTWFDHVSGFVGNNWKWLWTTVLVPAVGLLLRRWRQRVT
jgi:hypothetical protein